MSARAILEKVREAVSPSNGVPLDWKPKTDPASIEADVLQNLGMPSNSAKLWRIKLNLQAPTVYCFSIPDAESD